MLKKQTALWILFVASVLSINADAQQPSPNPAPNNQARPDSTRRGPGMPPAATTAPRPYKEVITAKAESSKGLFWVHKVEDRYYFEIPDSLMQRDILVVNIISQAPTGLRASGSFLDMPEIKLDKMLSVLRRGQKTECFCAPFLLVNTLRTLHHLCLRLFQSQIFSLSCSLLM